MALLKSLLISPKLMLSCITVGKKHLCLFSDQIICRCPWLIAGFSLLGEQELKRNFPLSLKIPAPSSDRVKSVYASIFLCLLLLLRLSLMLISASVFWRCRMEEERGDRVSYSGKQRLKQLSKHCQQCSWALEKDLLVLLCVLSEVTHWRLWFLSWPPVLALNHRLEEDSF